MNATFKYGPPSAKQIHLLQELESLGGYSSTRIGRVNTVVLCHSNKVGAFDENLALEFECADNYQHWGNRDA